MEEEVSMDVIRGLDENIGSEEYCNVVNLYHVCDVEDLRYKTVHVSY